MRRGVVLGVIGALLLGGLAVAFAQPSFTIRPVAVIGDPTPIGGTFAKFEDRPNVNESGDVAFVAIVAGGKARKAIFLTSKGVITKVAAEGDPTPIGGTFGSFSLGRPSPTKLGRVVFTASVASGKAPKGVFLYSDGVITKIVAQDDPTPVGGTFDDIDERPSVNDDETVAMTVSIKGGSVSGGIFLSTRGIVKKLVARGDPTPIGGKFGKDYGRPTINSRGAVLVSASIDGGPTSRGLFVARDGKLTAFVALGDVAPGTGRGRFLRFKDPDLSERDEVPFRAFLEGGTATEGIFLASERAIAKVVAAGDPLPSAEKFEAPVGRPSANGRGDVAFMARLKNGVGLFVSADGTIAKVVSHGDRTPIGGTFGDLHTAFLGDSGAVVFRASVVAGPSSEGVFVAGPPQRVQGR